MRNNIRKRSHVVCGKNCIFVHNASCGGSLISDFVAIMTLLFFSCSLIFPLILGLWLSLPELWTALEFFFPLSVTQISLHVRCYDLSGSRGQQLDTLPLPLESICILISVMDSTLIKLPRPTICHGHDITFNGVDVIMYAEGNLHLILHFDISTITKPLNMVRMRVLYHGQPQFLTHFFASKVVAATTINYYLHQLVVYLGLGLK